MRTPRSVDVEITGRCDLRCRYCYHFGGDGAARRELTTKEWLAFFDELGTNGVMSVCLAGGEPFIRSDVLDLIDGIVRNRMRYSLISNGGLVTDEIAEHMAQTGRCDNVQVSVDGSRSETHDACRGDGSWEGAIAGIRTLQRHGVPVTARITIHRHNVDDLEATVRFLLDDLALSTISTNAVGYLGLCQEDPNGLLLSVGERVAAMNTLMHLAERCGDRLQATAGPLSEARAWRRMEDARVSKLPGDPSLGRLVGCGCVFDRLAVRSDGAYIPCLLLSDMAMGRVGQDRLLDVWQSGAALTRLRLRTQIALAALPSCADCPYASYCTGNCPGLAYARTGDTDLPAPDSCLRLFLSEGGAMPALETGR